MKLSHPIQLLFLICLLLSGFWYIISASTGLLLILAVVVACHTIFARQTFQVYSLTKLMLAYLAWLFIVTFTSTVPNSSMMMLSILAALPIMYLVATNMPNFTQLWQYLRMIIFVIAVGFALLAIWQVWHNSLANGPLTDRNAFAAQTNLIWFPSVFLFTTMQSSSKRWLTILLGGGLFIITLALFATSSRGGILTWALLLPIMLWAVYKNTQSKQLLIIILTIAALAYACSTLTLHSDITKRTFQLSNDASTSARLMIWQSTIKMAQAHPIVGTGWDTFKAYYSAYRSPLEYTTSGRYSHSDYLQFATEGGVIATLLLLGLAVGVVLQLRKCLKQTIDANYLEAVALLLGLIAIFIQASVNFIFYFAFINVLAGLYLAYVAQLIETPHIVQLPAFMQIKPTIKRLLAGVLIIFFSLPYLCNLIAQTCFLQPQFGMKVINFINPKLTPYKIASLIVAIRPQEAVAQQTMLKNETNFLANNISAIGSINAQQKLLNTTLNRFDYVRAQNAFNPDLGVSEVKLLLLHQELIDAQFSNGAAYVKAQQILTENFKMMPSHTDSIIMLARLQVAQGAQDLALKTLENHLNSATFHLDQQLIYIEMLRLRAAPYEYVELSEIEIQLREVAHNYLVLNEPKLPYVNFFSDIDTKLGNINMQIKHDK